MMQRPFAFAAVLWALVAGPVAAEPVVPADDQVVETLSADPAQSAALRAAGARLAEDPADLAGAIHLAAAYAGLGRRHADPRYDGYAQAALAPWWDQPAAPVAVLLLRATLAQRRHDFAAALADIDRVLARQPRHPQAWLGKATILAVQGETDAALAACARLTGVDRLIVTACAAAVARSTGAAAAAYDALAGEVRSMPDQPEIVVWAQTLLAELAGQLADFEAAERHFLAVLRADPDNAYAQGAYADLLLDGGRPEEVRDLLQDRGAVDPLLLRLAIAEQRLGDPARERHVAMLASRFETARRRGDAVHRREEARFHLALLGEPERALELALANTQVQREPADLRLVLEAALAAGHPRAAGPALAWIERSGMMDPQIDLLRARLAEPG
jgi:tetratricopeptide (TPR) repeat protein